MKNIIGIKCKGRIFVSEFRPNNYKEYSSLEKLIINGKSPEKTFHPNWCVIDSKPVTVQRYVKQPDINHRYELINKSMESDKIKLVLKKEDVTEYNIKGGGLCWKDEYKTYQSLYKKVSDKQPDILEYVAFEYETVTKVKEAKEYKGFAYDVQKTKWAHEGLKELKENEVQHQLIDKIIFPDILLPARPCSLTSKQSFDIVRQYIKQHINYDVAFITSDYNFCFTVKKKIFLAAPEKYTVDVNNLWNLEHKNPSKLETKYNKFREIECFNMAPKEYQSYRIIEQSYRIIEGFRGKTQEDLKNNIDSYCRKLIEFINEPVVDCPHCKGRGVIDEETSYDNRKK
jgi:hypothetical protein